MPLSQPVVTNTAASFVEAGSWVANTVYARNQIYTAPTGERRIVALPYQAGATYASPGLDANNTVPASLTYATTDARYAPLGAAYKMIVGASGDLVSLAQPLLSNGIPIVSTVTVADLEIDLDYPSIGGSTVWRFSRFRYSDQTDLQIGTVTVAAGARSGTAAGAGLTNTTLSAGDRILVRNTAANGTTFPGQAVYAYISLGGTLPVMPNPSNPATLTVTPGASTLTLNWTAGANSTGTLVLRDGSPYAIVGGTTYVDDGPTNAGLASAESHNYSIAAISPGGISAISGTVAGTVTSNFSYYGTTAGALATVYASDWTVVLGGSAGTAAAVSGAGLLTYTSGNSGTLNNSADRVLATWVKDGPGGGVAGTHTAWRVSWALGFGVANSFCDQYFSANAFSGVATAFTTGVQLEMVPASYRFGFKGTSPYTSFQNITATSGGFATTTSASGGVAWPAGTNATNGTATVGVMFEMLPRATDNTQVCNWWVGTTAQLATFQSTGVNNLTKANSFTLTAAMTATIPAGDHHVVMLGSQTGFSALTQTYCESNKVITPLTGLGL